MNEKISRRQFMIRSAGAAGAAAAFPAVGQIVTEASATRLKWSELRTWLFLTVVMAPVLAVGVVSGWGFVVWMWQTFVSGPPTY